MKKLYFMASLMGIFACGSAGATDATIDDASQAEGQCVCPNGSLGGFYGAIGIGGNFSKSELNTSRQSYENDEFLEAAATMASDPAVADKDDAEVLKETLKEDLKACGFEEISATAGQNNGKWGVRGLTFQGNKHEKVANLDKGALIGVVAIGYGNFFNNNIYLGGECLVDFGKKTENIRGLHTDYVNNDAKEEWSTLEQSGITPVISIRGGYYLDTIKAMPYLKFGFAFVNVKAANKYSSIKLSKAVPELTLGIEKALPKRASLRFEVGYKFNSKTSGQIKSNYLLSPEFLDSYPEEACLVDSTKTSDVQLESKGFVLRLMTAFHI